MKVSKTISPAQWMTAPETVQIMHALNTKGSEPQALFVGGCVRHVLIGEDVVDIDIATIHTPAQVQEIFANTTVKVIPTGIDHGTVTVVIEEKSFEVTTLRQDVETDGRHAVVAFTQNWLQDAQRRDFTMNTLLMDLQGQIYDPTGQGIKDLESGQVLFVGDPAQRIAEDYLRILRFFRFYARYGRGDPDVKSLQACRAAATHVLGLSRERITQEFFKILLLDRAVSILELMFQNNVLEIFSEVNIERLRRLCDLQKQHANVALSSRLFLLGANEEYLIISKSLRRELSNLIQVLALPDLSNEYAVKMAIYKHGRGATTQALFIEIAQNRITEREIVQTLKMIENWNIPVFPVTGDDLIKEGYKPGPELGKRLRELEEEWLKAEL